MRRIRPALGGPLNVRAEAVPRPHAELRLAWDPPADVVLAHIRGWWVDRANVESCEEPVPGTWTAGGAYPVEGRDTRHLISGAAYFRVASILVGAGKGAYSAPVCADTARVVASAVSVAPDPDPVAGAAVRSSSLAYMSTA